MTVVTYDSAAIHTSALQGFGLLVFDEVHHLPADTYRTIAEGAIATARLGLSATPERSDLRHDDLDRLVGPVVYERLPVPPARIAPHRRLPHRAHNRGPDRRRARTLRAAAAPTKRSCASATSA